MNLKTIIFFDFFSIDGYNIAINLRKRGKTMIPTDYNLSDYDPHTDGFNYLSDIANASMLSEILNTSIALNIFEIIDQFGDDGVELEMLSYKVNIKSEILAEFLIVLKQMGFLFEWQGNYSNSLLSKQYLLPESIDFVGGLEAIQRTNLNNWKKFKNRLLSNQKESIVESNIQNQHCKIINQHISNSCTEFFEDFEGAILIIGNHTAPIISAFLQKFPQSKVTVKDPCYDPTMIDSTVSGKVVSLNSLTKQNNKFKLIFITLTDLSPESISDYCKSLTQDGILMVHDYFREHKPLKSALNSINQLLQEALPVRSAARLNGILSNYQMTSLKLVPLESDTAIYFAAKNMEPLSKLKLSIIQQLKYPLLEIGFEDVIKINPDTVVTTEFAKNKCTFGCSSAELKHCERNHMPLEETRNLLDSYSIAFLLKGAPGTGEFQRKVLKAEALAFKKGYHKAFSFWAGPCSICPECDLFKPCSNTKNRRPSMEGSGIDVFETVRNNGENLKTLSERGEFVKYYALLLLK
ncbi:DUF2284 domain-containing protein [Eubacteriaceae bacterium ES3]|nr:DUF2284 domain-containing protein [Eubacteriaceae bacterium ES3]